MCLLKIKYDVSDRKSCSSYTVLIGSIVVSECLSMNKRIVHH